MEGTGQKSSRVLVVDHDRLGRLIRERVFTVDSMFRELIKNSYEAEAEKVYIKVYEDGDIVFSDEGEHAGMSDEDIDAFLTIGTARKSGRRFTENFRRPIAGEQGIGRLSFTQLYRLIEVETEKDGRRRRFRLDEDMISSAFSGCVPVEVEELEPGGVNGTTITCMGLKEGTEKPTAEKVRKYIESNFRGILLRPIGPFKVFVNGEEVKVSLPRGISINIEKAVEGVVVKGRLAEDSFILGHIIVAKEPVEECGIQLSVNGAPIGPRRSLGELVGNRSVDEAIPPSKVWGWIEAPFLKFTMGREFIDTNHFSYHKFREKVLEVVAEIKEALKRRESEEISRIESSAFKEAKRLLEKALKFERDLRPEFGFTSRSAVGQNPIDEETGKLRDGDRWRGRRGRRRKELEAPHQTHAVHVGRGGGLKRGLREKGSWTIEPVAMPDPLLISWRDEATGVIRINQSNPMYVKRARDKKRLRDYILWIAAREIADKYRSKEEKDRALTRLYSRLEVLAHGRVSIP